jgi:hypothetical protein
VSAEGTTLHFRTTCPDHTYRGTANIDDGFTIMGSEIWLFQPPGEVEVYAHRP